MGMVYMDMMATLVMWPHCKKSIDFTVKYLASGCQFCYRYFYGRLPVEHF